MRALRAVALVTLLTLAGSQAGAAPAPGRSTAGCPAATRCGLYSLQSGRWPAARGAVTIRYRVNVQQPWVIPKQAMVAIGHAAAAWEKANPNVRFVYEGETSVMPQLGNGVNEIAWVPTLEPDVIAQTNHRIKAGRRLEADTLLNMSKPFAWEPCRPEQGGCSDDWGTGIRMMDVQTVMTQQFGHWLGLMTLTDPAARDLTMFASIGYGERRQSTLGLGDILGVRAAYPCRGCAMPRVVTP